ncbi:general stress protein [Bacillus coahuilensis m2-6]|uniref:General stress protein n=1 Tax=Bacillus coahuilensis p1.1.43 TaxID=1150625 RepID=A0A147KC60_9BACI|nr:pyridoxamine 5'-phosphate oxidase family protein [Bacillus coahuilensis]KUP09029.1 general stress protein [Bacillus coahuilensis p1.1.43]KUP09874.1 general stress protein [Bacillus coahuilensis m2-6]
MTTGLKDKVLAVISDHQIGTLATIRGQKPYSRFMIFYNDDLTLFAASNSQTIKVDDMKQNPHVHILLGYGGDKLHDNYVEMEATASIEESQELKNKFWNESLKRWIPSADDPEYVLLRFTPDSILYYEEAGKEPQELSL